MWTGDSEGVLREWDLEAGRVVRRLDGLVSGSTVGLALTPDGAWLHWISGQGFLGTVDLATGELRGEPGKLDRFGSDLVGAPDGSTVAVLTDRAVELRSGDLTEIHRRFDIGSGRQRPRCVVYSPDGDYLAIGVQNPPEVRVYRLPDLETGPLHELSVGQSGAYELAFTPDGRHLVVGQIKDSTIYSFPEGEELGRLPQGDGGYVAALEASPDGRTLVVYGAEGQLRFWDAKGQRHRFRYDERAADILDLDVSEELDLVVTGDEVGRVRRWSLSDGQEVAAPVLLEGPAVGRVEFTEGDALEVVTVEQTGAVRRWQVDPETGTPSDPSRRESDRRAFLPARTPDGSLELRPHAKGYRQVELVDAASGEILAEGVPHVGGSPKPGTRLAAFHPSGRYFATAGEDRMLRLHRAPGFEEVLAVEEPLALRGFFPRGAKWLARRLRFSGDGRLLALGGVEGSLILYELEFVDERRPGERLRIERRVHVIAHTAPIHALAFGRSSSLLLTASADGSALAWDVDQVLSADHRSLDLPASDA